MLDTVALTGASWRLNCWRSFSRAKSKDLRALLSQKARCGRRNYSWGSVGNKRALKSDAKEEKDPDWRSFLLGGALLAGSIYRRRPKIVIERSPLEYKLEESEASQGKDTEESEKEESEKEDADKEKGRADDFYQSLGEELGMMIFSGSGCFDLAKEICAHLNTSLSRLNLSRFTDGEVKLEVLDNVRSRDVYVIQSIPCPRSAEGLHGFIMELFLIVTALRRASAERITCVLPYMPYGRQEDLDATNARPLAVADMTKILSTIGADRVVLVDSHTPRVAGFFSDIIPVTNLQPHNLAIHYLIKTKGLKSPVIVAPVNTAGERAKVFWSKWKEFQPQVGLATLVTNAWSAEENRMAVRHTGSSRSASEAAQIAQKYVRGDKNIRANEETSYFVGDVKDRDVVIVDDMIDTGMRVYSAAQACKAAGAKRIFVYATHGVLSAGAVSLLDKAPSEEVIITNTITVPSDVYSNKLKILNISKLLAEVLTRMHLDCSGEPVETDTAIDNYCNDNGDPIHLQEVSRE